MTSPLIQEHRNTEDSCFGFEFILKAEIDHLQQDPWPCRCKVLEDADTYISGTETIEDVPDEERWKVKCDGSSSLNRDTKTDVFA